MSSPRQRLERRLEASLARRDRSLREWLVLWSLLIVSGFSYPLALTTRVVLGFASLIGFRHSPLAGAIPLALCLVYVLQAPLVVGIWWGSRDLPRAD
jgi:hypothetical protein